MWQKRYVCAFNNPNILTLKWFVDPVGFEPTTPSLQSWCSSQLS